MFFRLLVIASFTTLSVHAEYRTWTNPSGTTIDAEFMKQDGDNVTLRLRNGKLTTFSQSKLSDADREFIKTNASKTPVPESPAATNADRKAKWLTKMEKAKEESGKTGLPILVLFTGTSWCGYCIKLEDVLFSKKEFKTFANENLVLLMYDFESGGSSGSKEANELKKEFGVTGYPSFFLTDGSGSKSVRGGYNDNISPETFAEWVKKNAPAKK